MFKKLEVLKLASSFILLLVCSILNAQTDLQRDSYLFQPTVWKDSVNKTNPGSLTLKKGQILIQWLPIVNKIQLVQDHAVNWNDGAMVPAKGIQQYLRLGVQAQWKNVEIQIAPEMVSAQNQFVETMRDDMDKVIWRDYYRWYNNIELPEQMGYTPYQKIGPGQSFLKYHFKNISLAVGTESKWWGPSQRNALILSNSARGFAHISFKTEKPIDTKIGKWGFEFLTGWLENGGWAPPVDYKTLNGNRLYIIKNNEQRVFSGFNISYQPKWTKNLTLGVEQGFVQYKGRMQNVASYFPVKNIISRYPKFDVFNQPITLTAFYVNYEMPAAKTVLYGEFGWNLNQTSFRNWLLQPDKGYASTWGIKKIIPTQKSFYFELLAEITQTQLLTRAEQFTAAAPPSWYLGQDVRQGYTQDGKLLGAGVGPGGSGQLMELNWRRGNNRIGMAFERRVHNNDFYEYAFTNSGEFWRYYVDFTSTLKIDWQYKKWQFGPRISSANTNNYYWNFFQVKKTTFFTGVDIHQWTGQFTLQYKL